MCFVLCYRNVIVLSIIISQVLYSYSIGFVYILLGLLCVGGLGPAVSFCSQVGFRLQFTSVITG